MQLVIKGSLSGLRWEPFIYKFDCTCALQHNVITNLNIERNTVYFLIRALNEHATAYNHDYYVYHVTDLANEIVRKSHHM
jgi:hypothetical protein